MPRVSDEELADTSGEATQRELAEQLKEDEKMMSVHPEHFLFLLDALADLRDAREEVVAVKGMLQAYAKDGADMATDGMSQSGTRWMSLRSPVAWNEISYAEVARLKDGVYKGEGLPTALQEAAKLKSEVARLRVAESNLACICDVVNSWAREENYPETSDYLGECAIRDHINGLWGHVNQRHFARLDKLQAQLAAALDVLREVEWEAEVEINEWDKVWVRNGAHVTLGSCPACMGFSPASEYAKNLRPEVVGHRPDCKLAALLAGRE